ncbi:MAG: glycerophosphodiester phosphodiesterase [Eudoraea sp.]|nr:glycerophosphodiester phosphodiesterase [Eudoraea sp.]NNJ39932.1 glycerophosphodiester phosphodiesterase [Eudoraea sp.]
MSSMSRIILIALLLFFVSCGEMNKDYLVIGHRGAMGHETENSLASVQKALDLGVDMIEIDVFRIKSGEIVVFHDQRVERLTNGGGNIEEYYMYDLKKLLLDGNYSIPRLQEVLQLIDNKVALNIELKGAGTAGRVDFIMDYYVKNRGWSWDNVLISSFNWEELRRMREKNPDVAIAVLTESDPVEAIPVAQELGAVAINPNFRSLNAENIREIHEAGFKIYTWTVNEPEDIQSLISLDVDGIISDYPERVRQ